MSGRSRVPAGDGLAVEPACGALRLLSRRPGLAGDGSLSLKEGEQRDLVRGELPFCGRTMVGRAG